jgi:metallopeptidase MepB
MGLIEQGERFTVQQKGSTGYEFRAPTQAPLLFVHTPQSLYRDARNLINRLRKIYDGILDVKPDKATVNNVLKPIALAENAISLQKNILVLYNELSPDTNLRESARAARKLIWAIEWEMAGDEKLFQLINAVDQNTNEGMDPELQRLLRHLQLEMAHRGLNLSAEGRERLREVRSRISKLESEIKLNIQNAKTGVWLYPHELDDHTEHDIAKLVKGTVENEGKVFFEIRQQNIYGYMTNSEVRKRVTLASNNLCPENVQLFKELLIYRDEKARLLGYPNYAALAVQSKMAKTVQNVNSFLKDLQSHFAQVEKEKVRELTERKRRDLESKGQPFDDRFYIWDSAYYHHMSRNDAGVPKVDLGEYFLLDSTSRSVLKVLESIFNLRFAEITRQSNNLVWHEDVMVFAVSDEADSSSDFLGYLYLDLLQRDHKPLTGYTSTIQPGFMKEDGTRHYPSTLVSCAFRRPTSRPTMLDYTEMLTMFHELGHAVHNLISKTQYSRFHGSRGPVDFTEIPSQLLENWCWDPATLKEIGRHYSYISPEYFNVWSKIANGSPRPPERLGDDAVDFIRRSSYSMDILHQLLVLHRSLFDMEVHQPDSHEAIHNINPADIWNRLSKQLMQMDNFEDCGYGPDWGHGYTSFACYTHGYVASYYSYLLYGYEDTAR